MVQKVILFYLLFFKIKSFPLDQITHRVQLEITVDGISKGNLNFGIVKRNATKSVENFLNGCQNIQIQSQFKSLFKNERMEFNLSSLEQWPSEINDYYTEFGTLGQKRNTDNGQVSNIWTIFLRRMDYDGRNSQWLVFGSILSDEDRRLLEYLNWTGAPFHTQEGVPFRDIKIIKCLVIEKDRPQALNQDL